ncbi:MULTISPECIES: membrane protein insertase YidC [Roseobacteraceae]|jgi:YidC/Oxa1 family membrane protein insertase|uniref:Membrane protein insertase YidC n=1 Tax=Celeribacter baekdonensis B30 TaxID=1208323 RepID=K2ICR1_9RHOB|nr:MULTISPECIES: membrane protein insertase YidC [Roseobacteraceae]EKE67706.1 membrane protein insertase [Celeribacter baekdonensis B30]KAB6715631.1 membrane protein insertase YidC [Roseobacter sp. TSBP12]|tara:strand:+ start:4946 stop:6784 length:1839 start_codon:yes stop_codon:yes gene_type:complete
MDDQNKNLILAVVLSGAVLLGWQIFFPAPQPVVDPNAPVVTSVDQAGAGSVALTPPSADASTEVAGANSATAQQVPDAPRITIETPRLEGSISLVGGRIDDLSLRDYKVALDSDEIVTLLRPVGSESPYYALYGWAPGGALDSSDVPGANTTWSVESGDVLSLDAPVTLAWDNGKGLVFHRNIAIDENYMFTVTQSVQNNGATPARMAANNEVVKIGKPEDLTRLLVHEGAIRQSGKELKEISFKSSMLKTKFTELDADPRWGQHAEIVDVEKDGWVGFTDHYWMTVLIPNSSDAFTSVVSYQESADVYRTVARYPTIELAPGQSVEITSRLFSGAKEWETIRNYETEDGVYKFSDSTDWGLFFFFTKPIFRILHALNGLIGNMGWSIVLLTLILKGIMFPLAYKSYVSMARMKELQPEMEKLKASAGEDKEKLQRGMMELYKTNKVNPASGCLPLILQIPVFFSLYKVIIVTTELRQAPWIGWIKDLSAPDPSSILNLFGLLPFAAPEAGTTFAIISLGILPIILGISMWLQQKLNPAPTDASQAMIMAWMPWVFMFMLGNFASGLVLYWICNNTITFIQQYLIMRSHGHKPDVLGNVLRSLRLKKKEGAS